MAQDNSLSKMPFFDHIDELRSRLMKCLWVFMIGFGVSYFFFTEPVMTFLKKPLFEIVPPEQRKLYFTSLFENFLTHLKISGYTTLFAFAPFFFYQLWAFVAPGLHGREKRWVVPFVGAASLFFVLGAAFAYYILFPVGFKFFVTYGAPTDVPLLTIDAYYSTACKLLLLFGLAFEFPVLVVLLGSLGVIDSAFLRANRSKVIIGITVISAVFAPPDAMSMLILMIPIVVLFEGAIWIVHWLGVKRASTIQTKDQPSPLEGASR